MRKILLFLGMASIVVCSQAQQTEMPVTLNKATAAKHMSFDKQKFNANKGAANASKVAGTSYWLNYGSSYDQLLGGGPGMTGPAVLNANYLFPDSTIFGEFGAGNFSGVWIHHLGDMLDVKSSAFSTIDGLTWTAATSYILDSMSILYGYTRMDANTAVVDTLRVTLFTNATAANNPGYYFTGATATNYGTDTLSFRAMKYTQTTNMVNATGTYTFDIPLTQADTAGFYYYEKAFALPLPFTVPAGKLLSADVQFIPGYTWALGDQIDYVHNAFFFTSYEEAGAGTFPFFQDCNNLSAGCDYNTSHIVPQDVRYNTAGTWNGLFIPSYAYTIGYAFEHHLISYRVTDVPLSIDEFNSSFSLGQNEPNPFTNQTKINYQIKTSAKNVSFEIYNVAGVKIFEQKQANVNAGDYSVEVNDVNFASGIYFYSLTVDGNKVTKKMVVAR